MASWRLSLGLAGALAAGLFQSIPAPAPAASPQVFEVTLADNVAGSGPVSGRLLIFAKKWDQVQRLPGAGGRPDFSLPLQASPDNPKSVYVAAQEITGLRPGQKVEINADRIVFPEGFSKLTPGAYGVFAVLDVDHNYAYSSNPYGDDLQSEVVRVDLPAARPALTLTKPGLKTTPWSAGAASLPAARADTDAITFLSPSLSAFHHKPTYIRGWLVKPPGYNQGTDRYPVVYRSEGFGSTLVNLTGQFDIGRTHEQMVTGETPPMIWVYLDHSGPTGTNEFADSANNGPWGKALTEELIPWLEARYRMDAKPSGRFLTGHSSGGWMAIWDQVKYPKVFGGAWPTSPDPVDFRSFTNIDIYAKGANAYRQPDGTPTPLVRRGGAPAATFENYSRLEDVLGQTGGQIHSFDWVFSPRGPDGQPKPLFNHDTGAVDPVVAAYWRDHYDIGHLVQTRWPELKSDLDGKIHLTVGTIDTYYLDRPARLLKTTLDSLGARSEFKFVEGKDHGTVMAEGRDPNGVDKTIAWEMYAVARPGFVRPPESVRAQEVARRCGRVPPPPRIVNLDLATYDQARPIPNSYAVIDGQNAVTAVVETVGAVNTYHLPASGSPFRGEDGKIIGTLIVDPLCAELTLINPPTPQPAGALAIHDKDGKLVIRTQGPVNGDRTPLIRFASP